MDPVQTMQKPEAGVTSANESEGASFLMNEVFGAQPAAQPVQPAQSVQPVQPAPAPQPAPQAVPPPVQQVPVQVAAPPPPPPPSPVQQPVQPPPPVDFTQRYAGQQAPADPLASLQAAPDLPPEQPVAPPQEMNPQQNHAWAAIRAQSNANRRMAEDYRSKYNQLVESTKRYQEEKATFGEQLNKKDAEIKALQDEIGRTDLTRSPEFQQKYDAPIAALRDDVARTLVDNGLAQDAAVDLAQRVLAAAPGERPDLMRELPTHVQGILMVRSEEADRMFDARDAALADWRASAEGLAAVQERGSSVVAAQHVDKMATAAVDLIRAMRPQDMPPAYQVVEPTFAADRDAQEQKFRAWVQQAPEEQKYAAMLEGFMAPKTYEMLEHTMRENEELKRALAAHGRLAAPPVSFAPSPAPVPPPPPPPQAPTVRSNGYSQAPDMSSAQAFVQQTFAGAFGQR